MGVSGHLHAPATLTLEEAVGTAWIRDCVGPRGGLDRLEGI